jgi:flagellar hook protein FlgE
MTASALFNTALMGMSAQTSALGAIAENISNSSTVGYKQATTQFSTILTNFAGGGDIGGGVSTKTRFDVTTQGGLQSTSSATDLAIKGSGFFVVSDSAGQTFLTRAGSFVKDEQGRLVNSAGYYLMGFSGGATSVSGGLSGMQPITVNTGKLISNPSTTGSLAANLDARASVISTNLPSTNAAASSYTSKTSITAFDNLGTPVVLDVYLANTGSGNWEMDVYDASTATSGGFPYSSGPILTQSLSFDPTNGNLLSGSPASIPVPNGQNLNLDLSNMTQLGAAFTINNVSVNGNAASAIASLSISSDGVLSYNLASGQMIPAYTVALADVNSPDNLTPLTGNVFSPTLDSGQAFVGVAGVGHFGTIVSSELEGSTVDLAAQLSNMIVAQRSYTANSQVFQVASDVLQVLNNLK